MCSLYIIWVKYCKEARKKQSFLWILAPQLVKLEIHKNVFSVEYVTGNKNLCAPHHHHHLFFKRLFPPRSARVRRFSRYEASPHIPEHYPFRVQTKLIHIILYTLSPSLSAPTRTSHLCHHHISTGRHPIRLWIVFFFSLRKYFIQNVVIITNFFCDFTVDEQFAEYENNDGRVGGGYEITDVTVKNVNESRKSERKKSDHDSLVGLIKKSIDRIKW